ncbi:MAG: M23 family metallopeptidase, partial [Candidatus Methylomirabilales bacterium]
MMVRRSHTVLILSDTPSSARRFHVRHFWVRASIIGGTVAFLALSYVLFQYLALRREAGELQGLRKTVQAQGALVEKLAALEKEVERLRVFDHQVRLLAGMEKGTETAVAVGGGTHDVGEALAEGERVAQKQLLERMYQDLQRLEREVALREESLQTLTEYLTRQKDRLTATPSIWPTRGYVSSRFGPRKSPFTGRQQQHTGIDIAAALGTPIVAPADGVVTFAGRLAGYGRAIVVNHGFGFKTFYGHNKK